MSPDVPETAVPAWRALGAMQASKRKYFTYLRSMEERYEKYGEPDAAEQQRLARLLDEHNTAVSAFKEAMRELRVNDAGAHGDLLKRIVASSAVETPADGDAERN